MTVIENLKRPSLKSIDQELHGAVSNIKLDVRTLFTGASSDPHYKDKNVLFENFIHIQYLISFPILIFLIVIILYKQKVIKIFLPSSRERLVNPSQSILVFNTHVTISCMCHDVQKFGRHHSATENVNSGCKPTMVPILLLPRADWGGTMQAA